MGATPIAISNLHPRLLLLLCKGHLSHHLIVLLVQWSESTIVYMDRPRTQLQPHNINSHSAYKNFTEKRPTNSAYNRSSEHGFKFQHLIPDQSGVYSKHAATLSFSFTRAAPIVVLYNPRPGICTERKPMSHTYGGNTAPNTRPACFTLTPKALMTLITPKALQDCTTRITSLEGNVQSGWGKEKATKNGRWPHTRGRSSPCMKWHLPSWIWKAPTPRKVKSTMQKGKDV